MSESRQWEHHSGPILDSARGFDVIECETCGFKHIVPIPTAEELDCYYRDEFYTGGKSNYFQRHQEDLEWWNMVYEERYRRFEQHLSGKLGRILDVGCGPGFFLKLGKERGWDALGIEPNVQAADHARSLGLEVINDSLGQAYVGQLGKFDVVHVGWVMEHLPDPVAFARLCYELLKPNGLLCTIVANDYNPLQQIVRDQFGYQPWWLVPPEHINYFSIDSLKHLLVSCGFEVMHVTTTFPMEVFLFMGDNYVGNNSLGRACHNRRKNLEFALTRSSLAPLKSKLYQAFAHYDLGRDIDMTVKKAAVSNRPDHLPLNLLQNYERSAR